MSKRRGFVLVELVAVLTAIVALGAIEEWVRPPLERLCTGFGTSAGAEHRSYVRTDVARWVCVPLARLEDAENELAKRRADVRTRTSEPPP
jgi:hypothetical protein